MSEQAKKPEVFKGEIGGKILKSTSKVTKDGVPYTEISEFELLEVSISSQEFRKFEKTTPKKE